MPPELNKNEGLPGQNRKECGSQPVLKLERTKDHAANRTKPSLGRPDIASGTAKNRGSVTPLLNADMSGQDAKSDQVSTDNVSATRRLRVRPCQRQAAARGNSQPTE